MDAGACHHSPDDEGGETEAKVKLEELDCTGIKTEVVDSDHCDGFGEIPQYFLNRSGQKHEESEAMSEEEAEFKRLMDKLADFQSETGSRGIVMSPAKFDAIIYNLKTADFASPPSRFRTWIESRGFYLADYVDKGLRDVLMKPARVDKKSTSGELGPPLTVIHSRDLYDVTKYVHSVICDHGGYKRVLSYMQSKYFGVTRGYVQQFCLLCPYCRSKKRSHKALLAANTSTTVKNNNNSNITTSTNNNNHHQQDDEQERSSEPEVVWRTIYSSAEEEIDPGPIDMTINNTSLSLREPSATASAASTPANTTASSSSSSTPFSPPSFQSPALPPYRHDDVIAATSLPIPNAVAAAAAASSSSSPSYPPPHHGFGCRRRRPGGIGPSGLSVVRGGGGSGGRCRGRGRGRGRGGVRGRGRGRGRGNLLSFPPPCSSSPQQLQNPPLLQRMEVRLESLRMELDAGVLGALTDGGGRVYAVTLKDHVNKNNDDDDVDVSDKEEVAAAKDQADENDSNNNNNNNSHNAVNQDERGDSATHVAVSSSEISSQRLVCGASDNNGVAGGTGGAGEDRSRGDDGGDGGGGGGSSSSDDDVSGGDGGGHPGCARVVSIAQPRATPAGKKKSLWSKSDRKAVTYPAASDLTMEKLKRRISTCNNSSSNNNGITTTTTTTTPTSGNAATSIVTSTADRATVCSGSRDCSRNNNGEGSHPPRLPGQQRSKAAGSRVDDSDDDDAGGVVRGDRRGRKRRGKDRHSPRPPQSQQRQRPPPHLHPQRPQLPLPPALQPLPSQHEAHRPKASLTPPPPSLSPQAERRAASVNSDDEDGEIRVQFSHPGDSDRQAPESTGSPLTSLPSRKRTLAESLKQSWRQQQQQQQRHQGENPDKEAKLSSVAHPAFRASFGEAEDVKLSPASPPLPNPSEAHAGLSGASAAKVEAKRAVAAKTKRTSAVAAKLPPLSRHVPRVQAPLAPPQPGGHPPRKASPFSQSPSPVPTPNPLLPHAPILRSKLAPAPSSPFFSRVQVDVIDMTHTPNRPFFFIGHVTDLSRKLHVLFPLQEATPTFVAAVLDQRVLAYYGLPIAIRSNLGHAFVDQLIRALSEIVEGGVSCTNGEPPPKPEAEVATDGRSCALEANSDYEAGRTNVVEELIAMLSVERRGSNASAGGGPPDNVPWLVWLPRIMRSLNRDWHAFLRANPSAAFPR